jgi:protocatechuate 3,4-dioxygenase beta subunit
LTVSGVRIETLSFNVGEEDRSKNWFKEDIDPFGRIWPELLHGTTDASGAFTLAEIPEGQFAFRARGAGLGDRQFAATVPSASPLAIVMKPEAVITGAIKFADNTAGKAVSLQLFPETAELYRGSHSAITDERGNYRFDGLAEGIYTLIADRSKLPEWTMPARAKLRVMPGETLKGIDATLERGGLVNGSAVASASGKPINGAVIAALSPAEINGRAIATGRSDAEGNFTLRLPTGKSLLYVMYSGDGFVSPPQQGQRVVTVGNDGGVVGDVTFRMNPAPPKRGGGRAKLHGKVIDAAGKPIPGVRIGDSTAEDWGDEELMPVSSSGVAITNGDGEFDITISAGFEHKIAITSPDYSGAAEPFTPAPGEAADMVITATARPILSYIAGRVVDPEGHPIAEANIDGIRNEETKSDAGGAFRIPVRSKDQLHLFIRKGGFEYREWVIPPAITDGRFVLHPSNAPTRKLRNASLPDSARSISQPMPAIDAESWILGDAPPAKSGKPILLMFTAVFDNGQGRTGDRNTVAQRIARLQERAAAMNATAVVIFSPESHEAGVRAALADTKVTASIGVDRFLPETEYAFTGLTQSRFGSSALHPRTQVFLIGADGKVQADNFDVNKTP